MEECSYVLDQQFWFLQCCEMAASWHLRPAFDAQVALRQFARKGDPWGEIFGEAGEPHWNVNTLPRRERLRHGQVLVVVANRGIDRLGHPIDHHMREQLIFAETLFHVAIAVTPGTKLLHNPRGQPDWR